MFGFAVHLGLVCLSLVTGYFYMCVHCNRGGSVAE